VNELDVEVTSAAVSRTAATPTIVFDLRMRSEIDERIEALALSTQIRIEPRKRHYSRDEESWLVELFGEAHRWGETLHPLLWTHVPLVVPGFSGETTTQLAVPCSYDFDVAVNKYLTALEDGEIPLLLLFSGTIFGVRDRRLQVTRISWNLEARYRLPVSTYRAALEEHFPGTAWLRVSKRTFDELYRFKSAGCYPTWEHAIDALLDGARTR
jgi:hypothetical protein